MARAEEEDLDVDGDEAEFINPEDILEVYELDGEEGELRLLLFILGFTSLSL